MLERGFFLDIPEMTLAEYLSVETMLTRPTTAELRVSQLPAETAGDPAEATASHASDYIEQNKAAWERWAPEYASTIREGWRRNQLAWGIWGVPESTVGLLEGMRPGADVIELGCGTATISAALARRGFRPVGVDFARPLLVAAAEVGREIGLSFPLLCANAENLHYDDASFDCAISDYGASLWCDPHRWIPEASRLLRLDGRLIFITNSALLIACTPEDGGLAGDRLVRDYFSGERVEFPADGAVEFHLAHGDWVRVLRDAGLVIENLIEVRPPPHATRRREFASLEWARRWPSEEIWVARKAGGSVTTSDERPSAT
jgi:SAM-dependent methyltransferase